MVLLLLLRSPVAALQVPETSNGCMSPRLSALHDLSALLLLLLPLLLLLLLLLLLQVPETSAGCMSPRLSALDDLLGRAGQPMMLHQLPVATIINR
jgi:hypothetical protein